MFPAGVSVLFLTFAIHLQDTWTDSAKDFTTQFWTIKTDLPADQAHDAGRLLDAVCAAYRNGLSMLPEQRTMKMDAWVFRNRSDYNQTIRGFYGRPENSVGMFIPSRGVTAVTVNNSWDSFEATAKHEAFHQFASTRFPHGIPAWLSEGLAEYFEHSAYINGALINGQVSNGTLQALQNDIQSNNCIPFIELMRMSQSTWNQNLFEGNGAIQYRQSWAMVHFLIHAENGRYASSFDQFLLQIARGINHETAFVEVFGTNDLVSFQNAWVVYVNQLLPSSAMLAAHRLNFLAAGMKELMSRERSVQSINGLRASLQTIAFKTTLNVNYKEYNFDANDQNNYLIPPDSHSANPKFHFVKGNPFPEMYTTGLYPFNLYVRWQKSKGEIAWSIVVGR